MLGKAAAMQDVFRAIGRLSQSHVTVLITGESGTGRGAGCPRAASTVRAKGKPFIAINTAAIPKDLLETNSSVMSAARSPALPPRGKAASSRPKVAPCSSMGRHAAGPTCRCVCCACCRTASTHRVGGQAPMKSNVRIIAATHQNLDERVRQGMFREDLLHRLNVVRLRLPPLRERREDVPLLMKALPVEERADAGWRGKVLTAAAMQVLQNFSFPGNVRQLENICHWITVMAPGSQVDVADLPPKCAVRLPAATTAEAVAAATAVPQDRPATVPAVMTKPPA